MFAAKYNSDNKATSLYITISCAGDKEFCVVAEDFGKANSEYANRVIKCNGERTIYLSFPVSPQTLMLKIWNSKNSADKDFKVTCEEKPLKSYNVWLDKETRDFLSLAIQFCQLSGFTPASDNGRIFTSEDKNFTIKYFNVIRDNTGGAMSTPARIGHRTGIIEVSKAKFDNYTIPMRLVILLHEFSHKYKNPKIGLQISNEIGADINALYIYLGLGFSKIDAICVFANVFLKAQTPSNVKRMRKIMDYINKFENGQFATRID
jgi:hypothetical protein